MKIKDVCKLAWANAIKRRNSGQVPSFLGLDGMLALMYDNICRFRSQGREISYDEVLLLASNAIFALEEAIKLTMPGGPYEEEEEAYEPEPPKKVAPRLQPKPPPPRFDGWQFNPPLAVKLRDWLLETNQWSLLTDEQRTGIEDVIVELQEGQNDEEDEVEEEYEETEQEDETEESSS